MKEQSGTNQKLIEENTLLKRRIQELEQSESERKRMAEALAKSEEKFRKAFYTSPDSVSINRLEDGMYISINPGFTRILGYTEEDIIGKTSIEYNIWDNPEDRERLVAGLEKDGEVANFEATFKTKGGDIRDGLMSASVINLDGVPHILNITCDITERKRAEQALLESENLFRSYIEEAPDGIYMYDLEGIFLYGNRKSEEMIGYRREELIGKNFLEANLLPENSLNKAVQLFQANLEGKSTGPDEIELINKEGRLVPVEISTNVIQRKGQRIVLSLARDITYRKRAEARLRQQTDAMDAAIDGMAILNEEGEYIYLNKAHVVLYGYENAEELVGKSWRILYDSDALKRFDQEIMPEFSRKGSWRGEAVGMKKKGGEFPQALSLTTMANGGLVCVVRDITERKQIEEALKKTLENLRKAFGTTIQVMVAAVESRDPYTAGHQLRVADLARAIATEMGLPHQNIEGIRMAGSIHDIGKLSIPAEILSKPTKLTDIEFSLIKEHPQKGYEMLKDVESPWPLAEIVCQHHERMDGSGYPRNLKEDDILMEARIMAVSDVVEAMSSHRPYRPTLGINAALKEIEDNKGTLYDSDVVDACLRLFRGKGFQLKDN